MKKSIDAVDAFLNRITMYRLVLYYLLGLWGLAILFGGAGWLPYAPLSLVGSGAIILFVSIVTNAVFAYVFEAHTNIESVYITALILALIMPPLRLAPFDWGALAFFIWAPVWAMAAKYLFAIRKKHLFNPAAFAVALTALTMNQSATWWVGGSAVLFPFVFLGGLLVVRKIRRADLVWAFFAAAAVVIGSTATSGPINGIAQALAHAPIFFFAFVMLTEPLTTPPTRWLRIAYGALVGALFAPAVHIGSLYSTPELALLAGNVFSYAVSPKWKGILRLAKKEEVAHDTYDFVFHSDRPLSFRPGQYLEWTFEHPHADSRGNRRYFTIASSPSERDIRIGIKFYDHASSFKKSMLGMRVEDTIVASQLAGDFTLPRNKKKKLVFIAGGIGITPFRSMIQYITDTGQARRATLLYSVRVAQDIAYKNVFEEAGRAWGLKTVYAVTDVDSLLPEWSGQRGLIDEACIAREVPDWRDRMFYLSGPHSMVTAFEQTLVGMGVARRNIKTDFFPGFA